MIKIILSCSSSSNASVRYSSIWLHTHIISVCVITARRGRQMFHTAGLKKITLSCINTLYKYFFINTL